MKSHFDFNLEVYEEIRKDIFNRMYYIDSHDREEEDEYYFFNNIVFDESLNGKNNSDTKEQDRTKTKHCVHSWKKYVGFTDVYYYCENCDEKSNNDFDSSKKWYLK